MNCSECGDPLAPLDRFCESCGEPVAGVDGNQARHEEDLQRVAAVSDRGRVRPHNEDAFSIWTENGYQAAVVCDGVATTEEAATAARVAAREAMAELRRGIGEPDDWAEATVRAIATAQAALSPGPGLPPFTGCTTIVAALAGPGRVVVANVGDSRAYWIGSHGRGIQLTTDDTWLRDAIAGGLPERDAHRSPRAHEITAWLGADAGPVDPHLHTHVPDEDGLLVVCSDGLWNYAEPAEAISALVGSGSGGPAEVARRLTDFALECGGGDNVTVAVADVAAPDTEEKRD